MDKRFKNIFYFLSSPLLVLSCGGNKKPGIDESISLVQKWAKDEQYTISTEWNEKISSTDSTGNTRQQEIKMRNVQNYVVEKIDTRAVATIRGKYLSLKTNGFDSEDSSTYTNTAMARRFRVLSQKEFTLRVDTLGNVLAVTGAEGFYNMGIKNPAMDPNKIMQETTQDALAIFPGKKVKKADTWEKTTTIDGGYPGIYKNTYTLMEVKDGMATIEVKTEVKPNLKAPPAYLPDNLVVHLELSGTRTGTLVVDLARGKTVKTDETLRLNGKAKGARDGKPFENVFSTEVKRLTEMTFGEIKKP